MEESGIRTVSITMSAEMTAHVQPPRALLVDFPLGHPMGRPNDPDMGSRVLREALEVLTNPEHDGRIVRSSIWYAS